MDKGSQLLSDVIVYDKYARYIEKLGRRELYEEIIDRNKEMHLKKFATHENFDEISLLIEYAYKFVYDKKVLPSMRSLQYAGNAIERQNIRIFNCSYREISDINSFSEILYLLLMGCGVGYSIQRHHVRKLPKCPKYFVAEAYHKVVDSAEGWAEAVRELIENYFLQFTTRFDYSDVRPAGAKLVVSGGLAPGYEILEKALTFISSILSSRINKYLRPIDCHSILCSIAECVLSGGNRRSALIALFSSDDEAMLNCKTGEWLKSNPHFCYANNSVVLERDKIKQEEFFSIVEKTMLSGFGEPGIFLTNNREYGCNPCGEASLENKTCCNLTTINVSLIESKRDALEMVTAATILGTLQASYTKQEYLSSEWEENLKRDALLGVSFTGIASNKLDVSLLPTLSERAVEINKRVAKLIGINPAKRIGLIKPEGTSSCLLGTSSGIHAFYAKYYIRRVRLNKLTGLYKYLIDKAPLLLEECDYNNNDSILCIPIKTADGVLISKTETVTDLLNRIKDYYLGWVLPTHTEGDNTHNISSTIIYKSFEKDTLPKEIYNNILNFNGITIFPFDNNKYSQAPFEEITESTYNRLITYIPDDIDFNFSENIYIDNEFNKRTGCDGEKCEYQHQK